jgi:hypothetical protein
MSSRDGGRLIPDQIITTMLDVDRAPNPFRFAALTPWVDRRSRWQKVRGRITVTLWTARYRLAHALYPFSEGGD